MFLSPLKFNFRFTTTKVNNKNNFTNFQLVKLLKPKTNNFLNQIIFSPFSQTRANSGYGSYSQSQSLSKPRSESNQGYTSRVNIFFLSIMQKKSIYKQINKKKNEFFVNLSQIYHKINTKKIK